MGREKDAKEEDKDQKNEVSTEFSLISVRTSVAEDINWMPANRTFILRHGSHITPFFSNDSSGNLDFLT